MSRFKLQFSAGGDIRRTYVPNPKPSERKTPSIPSLINLKTRCYHDNSTDTTEESDDLYSIMNFKKELEQTNSIKIDLGHEEMKRIITQMKAMNGNSKSVKSNSDKKNSVVGTEIPRYCEYLQGKVFEF
jgi:hypothetical protein